MAKKSVSESTYSKSSAIDTSSAKGNRPTRMQGGYGMPGYTGGEYGTRAAKSGSRINKPSKAPTRMQGGYGIVGYTGGNYGMRAAKSGSPVNRAAVASAAAKPMARIPTANPRKIANEIMALRQRAPKVNVGAQPPIKAQVTPADSGVIRTTVNMKNSPTPKRGTNLGVSSGKTTGTSVSRGGTGGRTTGGGRAAGGGYTNAGPAGPGASGRGTGGKR
jgi:hypothetical protein